VRVSMDFGRSLVSRLSEASKVVTTAVSDRVEQGKLSRGASSSDGYSFGDFTRGLLASSPEPEREHGEWGEPEEAPCEFGPPLRLKGLTEMISTPADGSTIVWEMVKNSCARTPHEPAVGSRELLRVHKVEENGKTFEKLELANVYHFLTYSEYMDRVQSFARGLTYGSIPGLEFIEAQGRLVMYAETQRDWMVAALAAFSMSIQVVTIYATLGEEGALHGLNETAAAVCIVDTKLLKVLTKILPNCRYLKHVITMTPCEESVKTSMMEAGLSSVTPFEQVVSAGRGSSLAERPPIPSDIAVIMYTSGTTGAPKGVLISQSNLVAACAGFQRAAADNDVGASDLFLVYLPLAHIMEMVAEISVLALGASMGYGTPHTLIDSGVKLKRPESEGDAVLLAPTAMIFAPAVFDKVYKGVLAKVEKAGDLSKWFFNKALDVGVSNYDSGSVGVNPVLNAAFHSVQAALGGRLKTAITGSAPLSPEIQRFMQTVLKARVRQGYGLTENCACACLGTKDDNSVRSVGAPLACSVIRLADWPDGGYRNCDKDNAEIGMPRGEILVGGPTVCMGYLVNPDSPDPEIQKKNDEEFVTIAGVRYFRTGDIGQVTKSGTLQIIDRKKDLWKGPNGEYVALSKVEAALKLVGCVETPMAYGRTGAEYPVALLCVAESPLRALAREESRAKPMADLCKDPGVVAQVLKACRDVCKDAGLNDFEMPKKICLLPPVDGTPAWTPENDMLTAALKLKRPNIVKAFSNEIDALYS